MLKQVILQSSTPMTLNIDNADPAEILILTGISGLSPADLTLFTGDFARDGGYYQGRRVTKRNPVFTFKLNEDYKNGISISDVREILYKMFLEPQAQTDGLQVTVKDDKKPDRYFICYTEKFDSALFSKDTTAQISTICVDPYLRSTQETVYSVPGLVSTSFDYDGSADSGFETTMKVTSVTNTVVLNLNGVEMRLVNSSNFSVNDIVVINTNGGQRRITVNGVDSMGLLTAASKWLTITRPDNVISCSGGVVGDGKVNIIQYKYRSAWWGV